MADPLSITASAITILGAVDNVCTALSKIRILRDAPDELLALNNEVSDFKVVLHTIERHFDGHGETGRTSAIASESLSNLSSLINRAKDPITKLEELIEYRFKKAPFDDGHFRVSRTEWLRARSVVERLRQNIRDSRQNIQAQMMLIGS